MADGTSRPVADDSNAGAEYRFERLTTGLIMHDMYFTRSDPSPGDRVPDFDLPTIDGERFRSLDLAEAGPTLLVFGSNTCPVTDSSAAGLRTLHGEFGDRVRFVMVNVREAHPGDHVPQPHTVGEKEEHARALKDHHAFPFGVAVDDIDGTLHRALSPKPNSAYLLGPDGTILFRAHWANDAKRLRDAVEAVADGWPPHRRQSRALMGPMLKVIGYIDPALETAGPSARRDMWRAAPPMAIMSKLSQVFSFLAPDRRGLAAIAVMTIAAAAVAVALVVLL